MNIHSDAKPVEKTGLFQIKYPQGHNWADIGHGNMVCRECNAELRQKKGYALYTPGNGACDN